MTEEKTNESSSSAEPVVIKKYANRRLYNTQTSSYVTLDHLCEMVKEGVDFEVRDARTGEDITRSVLTQIIFEEEAKGQNLLPIRFLRQLIRLYGDSMQSFVPGYLDLSMESFSKNQEAIKNRVAEAFGLDIRYVNQSWLHGRFVTNALQHAALAVSAGLADVVACVTAVSFTRERGFLGGPGDIEGNREEGGTHGEAPPYGLTAPAGGAAP